MLAGMISSPSAYSPRNFPENATERRNQVLQNMVDQGYITQDEYTDSYSERADPEAERDPARRPRTPRRLTSPPGCASSSSTGTAPARRSAAGCRSSRRSTSELQQQVSGHRAARRSAASAPTAAVVVLDNTTADVLAMVGGPDYQEAPFNLATNGHRQPGSSFKPFTLVTALEQGHSPDEVVHLGAAGRSPSGRRCRRRTARARRSSTERLPGQQLRRQVPRLRLDRDRDHLLGQLRLLPARDPGRGPERRRRPRSRWGSRPTCPRRAPSTRSTTGHAEPYNPALILGGLETGVTPLEMAHAYNTLAGRRKPDLRARWPPTRADRSGSSTSPTAATARRTATRSGDPVPDQTGASGVNKVVAKQVVDPAVAATAKAMLSTVVSVGTGHLAQTGDPTWGKTGTTDNNGDAWFCGATPRITACIWVGYPDSVTPMETEYGGAPGRRRDVPGADLLPDRQRLRRRLAGRPRKARPTGRLDGQRPRPRRPPPRVRPATDSPRRDDRRSPRSGGARAAPAAPPQQRTGRAPRPAAVGIPAAAPPAPRGRQAAASRPASGQPPAGAGSGRDRNGLPAAQKRHGSSVALLIPIRGPVATSTSRQSAARARSSNGARSSARAVELEPDPERLGELARARAQLARARLRPRRARIALDPLASARAPGSAPRPRCPRARRRRSAGCGCRRSR